VAEVKDEDEETDPSEQNRKKYATAREHFELINDHLARSGEALRYVFHFLTPEDFPAFFEWLRNGKIDFYHSALDRKLAEEI